MNQVRAKAKEIVEQYGRDGALSLQSLESAEFGVWDRLTPGALLVAALCLAAIEDPALADQMTESGDSLLSRLVSDDFRAIELDADDASMSWERAVARLSAYASSDTLDGLLTQAEDLWSEVLESGELTHPRVRDGESGPWDAEETPMPAGVERLDYGVLKVPRLEGARMHPLHGGERIVGVVVSLGDHALSLQVFKVPSGPVWDTVRPKAVRGVRDQGGSAEEAVSGFGPEVRARIPVVRDGKQVLQPTRIIGCDGPGWLLRGVYGGPAALADVVDPRAHHLFTQTVVDLSAAEGQTDATQGITEVEVHWPTRG
ncbi:DUF3710 domain-containing protein [Streptomyces sp. NPDC007251]|uniref:DUF3710 domain-containing protein n=1 Tax=Streptomyces sp. NPDC007251 TaxID=3154483 RepID=UPI0033FE72CB